MTTTIHLVRHGQIASNVTGFYSGWSDEDLSDTGYMQARMLSSRLAGLTIGSVYTSPLRRAYATAKILAEPHGLGVEALDDLTEIRLGDWQGQHEDEIREKWPELWKQLQTDPSELSVPNGESFRQVAVRAVRAFEIVLAASRGSEAFVVTHDVVIRTLVAHVLGVPNSIYRRLEIGNASLSTVRVADGNKQLLTLNDVSHLGELPIH